MTVCICGHAEFLHTNMGCLKWFLGCGCTCFEADDGSDGPMWFKDGEGTFSYDGIYQGKTWKV